MTFFGPRLADDRTPSLGFHHAIIFCMHIFKVAELFQQTFPPNTSFLDINLLNFFVESAMVFSSELRTVLIHAYYFARLIF